MQSINNRLLQCFLIGALAVSPLALSGCDQDGPAEKAGEKVDEAVQDTKRSVKDALD